jgi:hypothetical protein
MRDRDLISKPQSSIAIDQPLHWAVLLLPPLKQSNHGLANGAVQSLKTTASKF